MTENFAISTTLAFCLLGVAGIGPVASASEKEAEKPSVCCFTREGARQLCRVTPGEGESCAGILAYLNSAGTSGKSYCAGSKLRGGWEAADCSPDEPGKDAAQEK